MVTLKPDADNPLQLARLVGRVRGELVGLTEREMQLQGDGLNFTQFLALKLLGQDAPLTPVELARALNYNPGALTRLLDALQKRGFLRRRQDPSDRRAIRLDLTAPGKAVRKRALRRCGVTAAQAFACLSSREQDELRALLNRVLEHVQQLT